MSPIGLLILTEKMSANQCFCMEEDLRGAMRGLTQHWGRHPLPLSSPPIPNPSSGKAEAHRDSHQPLRSEPGAGRGPVWCFTVRALHATLGEKKLPKTLQFYVQVHGDTYEKGTLGRWFSSSFLLKLPFCSINALSSQRKIQVCPERLRSPSSVWPCFPLWRHSWPG